MDKNYLEMNPTQLLARVEYLEENRRFIQNVLEMALSLGDFQENTVLASLDTQISHSVDGQTMIETHKA